MSRELRRLCEYIAPRVPSSAHVRIIAAMSDFRAYHLGHPITDTTWCKWREFAYPDGMAERQWERETQRIWRRAQPLYLVWAGDCLAAYTLLKMAWR